MLATVMTKWVLLAAIAIGLLIVLTYMFFTVGQRGQRPPSPEQPPHQPARPSSGADPRRPDPIRRRRRLRARQPHL